MSTEAERIAETLAPAMGAGWRVEKTDQSDRANLVGPDTDGVVQVRTAGPYASLAERDRVFLRGLLPHELSEHRPWVLRNVRLEISVSRSRSPESITGDIHRRLMPGYREVLAASALARMKHDALARELEELIAQMIAVFGSAARYDETRVRLGHYSDAISGDVHVPMTLDHSVELKLRVRRDLALPLVAYLARSRRPLQAVPSEEARG